jgi:Predicted nucleoside-diphosphate sugar epimerases
MMLVNDLLFAQKGKTHMKQDNNEIRQNVMASKKTFREVLLFIFTILCLWGGLVVVFWMAGRMQYGLHYLSRPPFFVKVLFCPSLRAWILTVGLMISSGVFMLWHFYRWSIVKLAVFVFAVLSFLLAYTVMTIVPYVFFLSKYYTDF